MVKKVREDMGVGLVSRLIACLWLNNMSVLLICIIFFTEKIIFFVQELILEGVFWR